jgi:transcriptional regulator with XRE-family HTH domain
LSAREIARRAKAIADELGISQLEIGHQAVSAWVNGTRHPTQEHRQVLASVLEVPIENLNRACDADVEPLHVPSIFRPVTVVVHGVFQNYKYRLSLKKNVDINRPAVYQHWADMFSTRPAYLTRHFRHVTGELFGWIPDDSASPLVENACCLVPLKIAPKRVTLRILDNAESSQRRVWFTYLPDGELHVGIGYRDRRLFWFTKNTGTKLTAESYTLSRVDLVGYFAGNALFHFVPDPSDRKVASDSRRDNRFLGGAA